MQKTITRKEVQYIIRNRQMIVERIKHAEKLLTSQIEDDDSIIMQVSLPNQGVSMLHDYVGSGTYSDLYDTVERYRSISQELSASLVIQYNEIIEEKETVARVWSCFNAIKNSGKYYDVLYEYLIDDVPLTAIAARFKRSLNAINSWKRNALDMIIKIYEREDLKTENIEKMWDKEDE